MAKIEQFLVVIYTLVKIKQTQTRIIFAPRRPTCRCFEEIASQFLSRFIDQCSNFAKIVRNTKNQLVRIVFQYKVTIDSDSRLKMIDLFSFNKSLKSTWIKKYLIPIITGNGNFSWMTYLKIAAVKIF